MDLGAPRGALAGVPPNDGVGRSGTNSRWRRNDRPCALSPGCWTALSDATHCGFDLWRPDVLDAGSGASPFSKPLARSISRCVAPCSRDDASPEDDSPQLKRRSLCAPRQIDSALAGSGAMRPNASHSNATSSPRRAGNVRPEAVATRLGDRMLNTNNSTSARAFFFIVDMPAIHGSGLRRSKVMRYGIL